MKTNRFAIILRAFIHVAHVIISFICCRFLYIFFSTFLWLLSYCSKSFNNLTNFPNHLSSSKLEDMKFYCFIALNEHGIFVWENASSRSCFQLFPDWQLGAESRLNIRYSFHATKTVKWFLYNHLCFHSKTFDLAFIHVQACAQSLTSCLIFYPSPFGWIVLHSIWVLKNGLYYLPSHRIL